jgi:hypothetical protein
VLITKKPKTPIESGIAALFRRENIIEYKSPADYLSVRDFHKAVGYASFYGSIHRRNLEDLSVTLVTSRHPRGLMRYLQGLPGRRVEEREPGIHVVEGEALPIQIIEIGRLKGDNNEWLRNLGRRLEAGRLGTLWERALEWRDDYWVRQYLGAIVNANPVVAKEKKMTITKELRAVFEENGWTAEWEAKGRAEGEAKGRAEAEKAYQKRLQKLEAELHRLREGAKRGGARRAVKTKPEAT